MQNNRSGEDLHQITEGSRASGQSGQYQESQGSQRNHHLGLHTHRGVATASSSINQANLSGQGRGIIGDTQLQGQNAFQPAKRNSVAPCGGSSLAGHPGPASRGGSSRQEYPPAKSNPVKNQGLHHSMAQNENVNISNFSQNLRELVGGNLLDGSQTQQISAQLYEDMQNQLKGEPRSSEFVLNPNAVQQHLAGAPEGRSQEALQRYYQNQQAAAAGGRQLHQSKTHRASFGTSAIAKNQSRYSNLQNYGYQQRMERIGSHEAEREQVSRAHEQAALPRQATEAQVITNPHYQLQYQRPQYPNAVQSHHVQNLQISNSIQKANLPGNQIIENQINPSRAKESMITREEVDPALDPREPRDTLELEPQECRPASQSRADSAGAAPGAACQGPSGGAPHSPGGSVGSHSYKTASGLSGPAGMYRSKTQGKLTGSALQAKQNILSRIVCQQCTTVDESAPQRALIKAYKGEKQPIIHNSDHSVNCGHCGQFYALKDQSYTHISNSGRKQFQSQAKIVKTVREQGTVFKLDEPISEIFRRMRDMSNKLLSELKPHPYYLTKRVKRIDDLSYIAECLQSDNQTIHHAVHLMDLYSSKMNGVRDYDTLLISLVCLLISTKYLQIKYPGADTLNDMVNRRYTGDQIIAMEGRLLDTIDWQLMVFPIYDYVKLFISQGCLFENEDILKETTQQSQQPQDHPDETRTNKQKGRPNVQLAEHFKKYAEFFTDFCLYQECFMTVDPYFLACAIVAYARKYMGVAIIWPQELELLTQCQFQHFRDMYIIIENKYTENFPDHAKSQNYKDQILTEPVSQITARPSIRKNQNNNLQLSSDNKTQKTQNSSKKQGASFHTNTNNLIDLKTPDKCVFDFNSVISGNKNNTQDKFSYEKFQINSNSIEKFRANKKINQQKQKNLVDISASQTKGQASMVFSDNKRQNANSNSFKKMILKNQLTNNLSDTKNVKISNNVSQHQAVAKQPIVINNQLAQNQKRAQALKNSYQMPNQENYSSQKSQNSQPNTFLANAASSINQTQMSMMNNMVNSPSANINENEQEVPPFKPMIIKSNSQAIGGNYECKTTTKKSPKGVDLDKINTLKEAMNSVNITAKLPSSTTNQSSSTIKLKINSSFNNPNTHFNLSKDGPTTNKSYGALGPGTNAFGVSNGPIKINQKVKLNVHSSRKKNQAKGGDSTAKKSKKSQQNDASSSQKKMVQSKSYVLKMNEHDKNNNQATLNAGYQQKMAEQGSKNASQQQQQPGSTQSRRGSQAVNHQSQKNQSLAQQRNTSCVSHNQSRPVPQDKQQTYVSGKPKNNYTSYLYSNYNNAQQPAQQKAQTNCGCTGSSQVNSNSQGRSALSLRNAHQMIKRKNSFQNGNAGQVVEVVKVNVNKNISEAITSQGTNGPLLQPAVITNQVNQGKNLPNSLLRRATGGAQGRQTSIGALSHYKSSVSNQGMNNNVQSTGAENNSHEEAYIGVDSQGSDGKSGLPKNSSLDELNSNGKNTTSNEKQSVNPPAIIFNGGNMPKNKSFSNGQNTNTSTLTATKATLVKMIQENRGTGNQGNQTQQYMSQQPNIAFQRQAKHNVTHLHPQILANQANSQQVTSRNFQEGATQPQSLSLERAQQLAGQNQAQVQQLFDGGKPIQKMIKSGSQVLGKCRSRPSLNFSRKEMLKQLNEKKEKMSQLVEAAHATRPTSNERSSTKKPNQSEIINNFNQSQFEIQQLFQQKHPNQQSHHQRMNYQNTAIVSGFENLAQYSSYSAERPQYQKPSGNSANANNAISQFITQAPNLVENQNISNQINIQNLRPSYSGQQHEMKSQAFQEQQNQHSDISQAQNQQNYNQQPQQVQQQPVKNSRLNVQQNNHEIHINQTAMNSQNNYGQY